MKPPFKIRQATIADAKRIHELASQSWNYTYNEKQELLDQEEIDDFISSAYDVDGLKQTLTHQPSTTFSFLVMEDTRVEKVIGFGQIGYENYWEIKEKDVPEAMLQQNKRGRKMILYRLYLHPDYIGKGLGKQLLVRLEEFVRAEQVDEYGCMVLEGNMIGRKFYQKMGFIHKPEFDKDDEIYLNKQLRRGD